MFMELYRIGYITSVCMNRHFHTLCHFKEALHENTAKIIGLMHSVKADTVLRTLSQYIYFIKDLLGLS